MQDRRVFSRFPAKMAVKFLGVSPNKEGIAETEDVSAKGIGLVTREELNVHTPLEFWLKVPDQREPLYTRGEVVWSKKAGANKFRAGVNLEKADLTAMSRIIRVI